MKRYLKELKPTEFADLIAMNALYRPGPMAEIPRFIKSKNNPAEVEYPHISLEPILVDTYGVMVYQEQITQLLQLVANYSAGEADLVRKAIGKKNREIMQAEEPKFIAGCVKQGLSKDKARQLWKQIQPFADYSFNKAHATCYAQIAYWTAYLKAHYPAAFMAALMTSDYDDIDRLAIEIDECKRMGLTVLAPDVNESYGEFNVVADTGAIRFGMVAIKNVGSGAVEEILRARTEGAFVSLEDFLTRVSSKGVNRKAMDSLIKTGAFDSFGDRAVLLHNLDLLLAYGGRAQKQAKEGQTDLFGSIEETIIERPKLQMRTPEEVSDNRERLTWERELLGIYLSQHPLEPFDTMLNEMAVPLNSISLEHDGKDANVGGAISYVREITTKKGQRMAFIGIEDRYGIIEAVVFPNNYEQSSSLWQRDKVVLVRGKISARDREGNDSGEIKIIVEKVREINSEQAKSYQSTGEKVMLSAVPAPEKTSAERVYIKLASTSDEKTLVSLKEAIDAHSGSTEVVLVLGTDKTKQAIRLPGGIDTKNGSLDSLQELVGADNIVIQ
jgi:DNA polymerase-3 subunit alpha